MFKIHPQIICASLFTGNYDVNRNELLADDDFETIRKWYQSIINLGLKGIIFHNNFSEATVKTYQNKNIQFVKVAFETVLNANVYRYIIYQNIFKAYADELKSVFITDIADVEVIQNPFIQPLFLEHPDSLFCGDELEILDNEWMNNHNTHLRNSIDGFADYEIENKNQTLLNCGIIGGSIDTMLNLTSKLANIHQTITINNQTPYTLDMGAFNYIARTKFSDKLIHGAPVNTHFKKYEEVRVDCWFRHK
jgi:hypothetical protein